MKKENPLSEEIQHQPHPEQLKSSRQLSQGIQARWVQRKQQCRGNSLKNHWHAWKL
jgi:hypothetical protein